MNMTQLLLDHFVINQKFQQRLDNERIQERLHHEVRKIAQDLVKLMDLGENDGNNNAQRP